MTWGRGIPRLVSPLVVAAMQCVATAQEPAGINAARAAFLKGDYPASLAAARRANMEDVLAERLQHRPDAVQVGRLGADHDVEPALFGFPRRARHRGIDEAHPFGGEVAADAPGGLRFGGRGVDDDEVLARRRHQALVAVDDLLDLR